MGCPTANGDGARREREVMAFWKGICTKCAKVRKYGLAKGQSKPSAHPTCCGVAMVSERSVDVRAIILRKMGYSSYKAYLQSDLWAKIRRKVLDDRPNCEMCGRPAQCVHHRSYSESALRGERVLQGYGKGSLVSLCMGRHEKIEFTCDGRKRRIENANNRLNRVVEAAEAGVAMDMKSPKGKVGFGVHKERAWSEVPDSWLVWCRTSIKSKVILALVIQEIGARAANRARNLRKQQEAAESVAASVSDTPIIPQTFS